MKDWINISKCSGCSACAMICPKNCIKMLPNDEGFLYPVVDQSKCISCGLCEKTCPVLKAAEKKEPIQVYAAKNKDENIRQNSSSGGVFYLLAKNVLSQGGSVFGAAMTEDCTAAEHILIEKEEELHKLLGSKYLQSNTNQTYCRVKELLTQNKPVLFSGTPCQISGLKHYLEKDYDNLFTVDVICHGVPSQMLWKKYLEKMESQYNSKITHVSFRHKFNTWKSSGIRRMDAKKQMYFEVAQSNAYFRFFFRDLCLRKSCYDCTAKTQKCSDITLGDFWGIEQVLPIMNDGKGTSLVIIRTQKGKQLFDSIEQHMQVHRVSYEEAVKYNEPEYQSVKMPIQRETVFADMNQMDFSQLEKKYLPAKKKLQPKEKLLKSPLYKIYRKIRGHKTHNSFYLALWFEK